MKNYLNSNKILNARLENHITKIIIMQLRQSGELLCSQYHMIEAQLFQIDPNKEPKRHMELSSLALKVLELGKSITKRANEYELDIHLFLDGDA
jgi:hypothetical protein